MFKCSLCISRKTFSSLFQALTCLGGWICCDTRVLEEHSDQLLYLLRGELQGQRALGDRPPLVNLPQGGAQHQDRFLELAPPTHASNHVIWRQIALQNLKNKIQIFITNSNKRNYFLFNFSCTVSYKFYQKYFTFPFVGPNIAGKLVTSQLRWKTRCSALSVEISSMCCIIFSMALFSSVTRYLAYMEGGSTGCYTFWRWLKQWLT